MPYIPSELIDYCIDFLHSDHQALANCSLVARRWLPASRYHMYGTAIVNRTNMAPFLLLLYTPYLTISPYVHTLRINFEGCYIAQKSVAAIRLQHLPLLKSLKLANLNLNRRQWTSWSQTFSHLTELDLDHIYFFSFQHLLEMISRHSALTRLRLEGVFWEDDTSSGQQFTPPSNLKHLHLEEMHDLSGDSILEWLIHLPDYIPAIHTVTFDTAIYSVSLMARFCNHLGPSLHDFSVFTTGIMWPELPQELLLHEFLKNNTELRAFSIQVVVNSDRDIMAWVFVMLSLVNSPIIQRITIRVCAFAPPSVIQFDWEELEKILAHPKFNQLREVKVLELSGFGGTWGDFVAKSLPRIHAKGILVTDK